VIWLIARREIAERLRGRLTRVITLVMVVVVVAGVVLPGAIKSHAKPARIGLVGKAAQALMQPLTRAAAASHMSISLSALSSAAAVRSRIDAKQLDASLTVSAGGARIEVRQSLASNLRLLLQTALNDASITARLKAQKLPVGEVVADLQPAQLHVVALKPQPAEQGARITMAIFVALLMYVTLAMYGMAVASGVAQEKTSRTAEVLLAIVRPWQLMVGKVAGIGATALGQLALTAVAGVVANAFARSANLPSSLWALFPAFLLYFLLGFVLYAFAFAAAGAVISRQEELQAVTLPITMPLIIGYVLVFLAFGSANSPWLKVLSWLPPLSASLMPARIALGHVAAWEIPLTIVLMVTSIYAVIRLSSRVYAGALIRGGGRLSRAEMLALARGRDGAEPLRR
jgi:ABC-2 type transport system permease protein